MILLKIRRYLVIDQFLVHNLDFQTLSSPCINHQVDVTRRTAQARKNRAFMPAVPKTIQWQGSPLLAQFPIWEQTRLRHSADPLNNTAWPCEGVLSGFRMRKWIMTVMTVMGCVIPSPVANIGRYQSVTGLIHSKQQLSCNSKKSKTKWTYINILITVI